MFRWLRRRSAPVSRVSQAKRSALLHRAEAALREGDAAAVSTVLRPLLDDVVVHPGAHLLAAAAARGSDDIARMAGHLDVATRADATLEGAWRELATARAELGQSVERVAALRGLLALVPDDAAALAGIVPALAATGDVVGAAQTDCIHRLLDRTFDIVENPAAALHAQGRLGAAVDLLRTRIAVTPADARLWAFLGCTRQAQGHIDTAVACFREAVRRDPAFARAQRWLDQALEANPQFSQDASG